MVSDGNTIGEARVRITADTRRFNREIDRTRRGVDTAGASMDRMGRSASRLAATFAAGLGIAAVTRSALSMTRAFEDQRAINERLRGALKNIGIEFSNVSDRIVDAQRSLQDFTNYGDDETAKALTLLVQITGDFDRSLEHLSLTADFAAAANINLTTASRAVARALQGDVEALGRYLPMLESTASSTEAMRQLTDAFGGTAERSASRFTQFSNELGDFGEVIGGVIGVALFPLLTVLTKLLRAFNIAAEAVGRLASSIWEAVGPFQGLLRIIGNIIVAIAGLVSIYATAILATRVWTVATQMQMIVGAKSMIVTNLKTAATIAATHAQWLLNIATYAFPGVWLVAAIVAIIAIAAALVLKWDWVVERVGVIWKLIKSAFTEGWRFILAVLFPPLGLPLLIWKYWGGAIDRVKDIFRGIFNWLRDSLRMFGIEIGAQAEVNVDDVAIKDSAEAEKSLLSKIGDRVKRLVPILPFGVGIPLAPIWSIDWSGARESLSDWWNSISPRLKALVALLAAPTALSIITVKALFQLAPDVWNSLQDWWDNSAFPRLKTLVSILLAPAAPAIITVKALFQLAPDVWNSLQDWWDNSAYPRLKTLVSILLAPAAMAILTVKVLFQLVRDVWNSLRGWWDNTAFPRLKTLVGILLAPAAPAIVTIRVLFQLISNLWNWLKNWWDNSAFPRIKTLVSIAASQPLTIKIPLLPEFTIDMPDVLGKAGDIWKRLNDALRPFGFGRMFELPRISPPSSMRQNPFTTDNFLIGMTGAQGRRRQLDTKLVIDEVEGRGSSRSAQFVDSMIRHTDATGQWRQPILLLAFPDPRSQNRLESQFSDVQIKPVLTGLAFGSSIDSQLEWLRSSTASKQPAVKPQMTGLGITPWNAALQWLRSSDDAHQAQLKPTLTNLRITPWNAALQWLRSTKAAEQPTVKPSITALTAAQSVWDWLRDSTAIVDIAGNVNSLTSQNTLWDWLRDTTNVVELAAKVKTLGLEDASWNWLLGSANRISAELGVDEVRLAKSTWGWLIGRPVPVTVSTTTVTDGDEDEVTPAPDPTPVVDAAYPKALRDAIKDYMNSMFTWTGPSGNTYTQPSFTDVLTTLETRLEAIRSGSDWDRYDSTAFTEAQNLFNAAYGIFSELVDQEIAPGDVKAKLRELDTTLRSFFGKFRRNPLGHVPVLGGAVTDSIYNKLFPQLSSIWGPLRTVREGTLNVGLRDRVDQMLTALRSVTLGSTGAFGRAGPEGPPSMSAPSTGAFGVAGPQGPQSSAGTVIINIGGSVFGIDDFKQMVAEAVRDAHRRGLSTA